jgi:glycerol-3-phosphate dehydrogenase
MEHFDVVIIGGGINGAGIARDCAMRGLKTMIVDKNDFAYGTSSRSTKLVHGGIRYLENYQFKLVWEACHERKVLTQIAPQLVREMPFIMPFYKGDRLPPWMLKLGMTLYDMMAGFKNIRRHRSLNKRELEKALPMMKRDGLKGGGIYYDCQTQDYRLTLANIKDAVRHGATAKNYTEVAEIHEIKHESGKGTKKQGILEDRLEVVCQDTLTGDRFSCATSYIVNATGPWLDENLAKWQLDNNKYLRLTKGIHFFVPRLTPAPENSVDGDKTPDDHAILIGTQRDKRVFFIIPWGRYSLVGTTDTDFKGSPDQIPVNEEDIKYLLDELGKIFPDTKVSRKDVIGAYAGVRPLLKVEGVKEGAVTREYTLKEHKRGNNVILSVVGGKLTTYRSLAEKVTNRVVRTLAGKGHLKMSTLNRLRACETAKHRLPGSEFPEKTLADYRKRALAGLDKFTPFNTLPKDIAENLINTYGSEISQLIPYLQKPGALERISTDSPVIKAQIEYAREHEFARTEEDFHERRAGQVV